MLIERLSPTLETATCTLVSHSRPCSRCVLTMHLAEDLLATAVLAGAYVQDPLDISSIHLCGGKGGRARNKGSTLLVTQQLRAGPWP